MDFAKYPQVGKQSTSIGRFFCLVLNVNIFRYIPLKYNKIEFHSTRKTYIYIIIILHMHRS